MLWRRLRRAWQALPAPDNRAICAKGDTARGRPCAWQGSATYARPRPCRDRGGEGLESLGGRIDQEEMDVARDRLGDRGRDFLGRFDRDALERKIGPQHAAERRRLVDADLRPGERMRPGLEHDAIGALDRLV